MDTGFPELWIRRDPRLVTGRKNMIRAGDKVQDVSTQDMGKVRLGDNAPAFSPIRAGDKVRDTATQDAGKVRLGDNAPSF